MLVKPNAAMSTEIRLPDILMEVPTAEMGKL